MLLVGSVECHIRQNFSKSDTEIVEGYRVVYEPLPVVTSRLTTADIVTQAQRILEQYPTDDGNGNVNIPALLQKLGGETSFYDVSNTAVSLTVVTEGKFTVYVPKYTHPRPGKLMVARGLGHYFLHYLNAGLSGEVRFMREVSDATRRELNLFAYELLLPREKFISCWGDGWNSTADEHEQRVLLRTAARQFDVYSDMVKTWAEYLGLLPNNVT